MASTEPPASAASCAAHPVRPPPSHAAPLPPSPLRPILPRPRSHSAAATTSPLPSLHSSPHLSPHPSPLRSFVPPSSRPSLLFTPLRRDLPHPLPPVPPYDAAHSLSSSRPSIVPQLAAEEQRRPHPSLLSSPSLKQRDQAHAYEGLSPVPAPPVAPRSPPSTPPSPPTPLSAQLRRQLAALTTSNAALAHTATTTAAQLAAVQSAAAAAAAAAASPSPSSSPNTSAESDASAWEADIAALHDRLQRQLDARGLERHSEAQAARLLSDDLAALLRLLASAQSHEAEAVARERAAVEAAQAAEDKAAQAETAAAAATARTLLLERERERVRGEWAEERGRWGREAEAAAVRAKGEREEGERQLKAAVQALTLSTLELECECGRAHASMRAEQAAHARAQEATRAEVARAREGRRENGERADAAEAEADRLKARLQAAQDEAVVAAEGAMRERERMAVEVLAARQEVTALRGERARLVEEEAVWKGEKAHVHSTAQARMAELEAQLLHSQLVVRGAAPIAPPSFLSVRCPLLCSSVGAVCARRWTAARRMCATQRRATRWSYGGWSSNTRCGCVPCTSHTLHPSTVAPL